jgi:phenylacetate-CoA ligase
MLERLYRDVLIRGYEDVLQGRTIHRYWSELEQSQWLAPEELLTLQLSALRRLLSHAAEYSPYYRDEWRRRGLVPAELTNLSGFDRWPVIDRETVREHRMAMRSRAPGLRLLAKATGGSSGVPLQFDHDTESYERKFAAWHRGYSWAGAGPGTKQLYLWGTALGEQTWPKRLKARLYESLYRREVLSCFELNERTANRFLARLNRRRPDVIVAYTNPLYAFARMLEERGAVPFSPRALVVGAEKLHGFQRELIEKVFRAPVFETYGSREFTLIAAECDRHQGLHLTSEYLLVEVLDDLNRPVPAGTEGNVAITDLRNYGLPFIRYLNGDRAVAAAGRCACGRGLPRLERVVGRQLDILRTPDGRRVPGEFFPHLLKDYPAIRRFQVVQEAPEAVTLKVVLLPGMEPRLGEIEREALGVLGPAVRFGIHAVEDIPLTAAGKLQVVVSKVGSAAPSPAGTPF